MRRERERASGCERRGGRACRNERREEGGRCVNRERRWAADSEEAQCAELGLGVGVKVRQEGMGKRPDSPSLGISPNSSLWNIRLNVSCPWFGLGLGRGVGGETIPKLAMPSPGRGRAWF